MLIRFGARHGESDGVDLLLECHGRIRRFLAMARRLAAAVGYPEPEVAETARQIRRYFVEALPLHVLDEEETVLEMLVGRDAALDRTLAEMVADHLDHDEPLERLVAMCGILDQEPQRLAELAPEMVPLTVALEGDLLRHLELEERTIFPALRTLPKARRDALTAAIRRRRRG